MAASVRTINNVVALSDGASKGDTNELTSDSIGVGVVEDSLEGLRPGDSWPCVPNRSFSSHVCNGGVKGRRICDTNQTAMNRLSL